MSGTQSTANKQSLWTHFAITALAPFLVLAVVGPPVIVRTVIFTILWNLYVPQLLHLPPMRLVMAFGIVVLSRCLVAWKRDKDTRGFREIYTDHLSVAGILLVLGYAGSFFI